MPLTHSQKTSFIIPIKGGEHYVKSITFHINDLLFRRFSKFNRINRHFYFTINVIKVIYSTILYNDKKEVIPCLKLQKPI